ncbi:MULTISPECIES: hypothetical protein [Enterobacter]|uniref:hypothetical protein n=1 Tax=Enterobacter TaxID=547 RepID=UPI001419A300|nr:hypothetical protein [Enterobacter sp. Tr-810]NIF36645.1 hypothetical protein [Enterobacter sp. Tr-810]
MMSIDNELVVIVFRGFDRLFISIGGIISIWLGYKLFNKSLPNDGTFDGGIGSWSIRLQNIAPGVFFALFGASALIFSITHPLSYEKTNAIKSTAVHTEAEVLASGNNSPNQMQIGSSFSGLGSDGVPELDLRNEIDILNSLVIVNKYKDKLKEDLTSEQKQKITASYAKLYALQINLIDKLFGPGSLDMYQKISADIRNDPRRLDSYSTENKLLYNNIKSLFAQ